MYALLFPSYSQNILLILLLLSITLKTINSAYKIVSTLNGSRSMGKQRSFGQMDLLRGIRQDVY